MEVKNTVNEIKYSLDGPNNRLDTAERKKSELTAGQ